MEIQTFQNIDNTKCRFAVSFEFSIATCQRRLVWQQRLGYEPHRWNFTLVFSTLGMSIHGDANPKIPFPSPIRYLATGNLHHHGHQKIRTLFIPMEVL
jgi:hypothetical protein